jgi:hypothetical protein
MEGEGTVRQNFEDIEPTVRRPPKPEVPDDVAHVLSVTQALLDAIRQAEADGAVVSASNSTLLVSMPSAQPGTHAVIQVQQATPGGGRGAKPRRWEMTVTWKQGS